VHGIFAAHFIMPKLHQFLSEFPQIQLQLTKVTVMLMLLKKELIVLFVLVNSMMSDLIVRHLGDIQQVTLASQII
jgi:DNA-binding transcriptional LysR family regulator